MPRNEQELGKVKKLKGKSDWKLRVKGRMAGSEEGEVGRGITHHSLVVRCGGGVLL